MDREIILPVVVEPAWRQELVSEPFKYQRGPETGSPETVSMHRAVTLFSFLIPTLTLRDCPEARMSTDEKRALKTKKELFMSVLSRSEQSFSLTSVWDCNLIMNCADTFTTDILYEYRHYTNTGTSLRLIINIIMGPR